MMKLVHKFVKSVPEVLEDGVIYISMEYATAIHKCCCGCGGEVVTPFSPERWHLTFDGKTISLYPSIGNFSFKCQSHYWIKKNIVEWEPHWNQKPAKETAKKYAPKKKPKRRSLLQRMFRKDEPNK